MNKINKRIPGILPPPPKSEIDGKITDLSNKTLIELFDIRDRQLKLLNNKAFISKLADKGTKIQALYDKVNKEIKLKQEEEDTCNLLKKLNLNKDSVQNVEWMGKLDSKKDIYLDSDDDSDPEDVLHVLSQGTVQDKQVKVLQQDKPLITPEDLTNIGEIPHVKYLVGKAEQSPKQKPTGQYKPFKTTKSDVHNPAKEILRKKNKHWEVTAATPPPIVHGPAKVLSLEESLKLQQDYNLHLKEIEVQHAAEKLLARTGIKMSTLSGDTSKFGEYRQTHSEDSDDSIDIEGSDKEVHDEEPERGGVVFTVMK
ncbi:DNA-directed RNA polymerase II subunit GRINL1A [Battus philenor]|uniref:DNA-directed RNA polymerase II subunit GRINL1A n=1 Tax=Battus philenor TaxID=42288 RepID=UPI0035D05E58